MSQKQINDGWAKNKAPIKNGAQKTMYDEMMANRQSAATKYKKALSDKGENCCEVCRWAMAPPTGKNNTGTAVHHVIPVAVGGTHDESNLVALCPNCHAVAHTVQGVADWSGPKRFCKREKIEYNERWAYKPISKPELIERIRGANDSIRRHVENNHAPEKDEP